MISGAGNLAVRFLGCEEKQPCIFADWATQEPAFHAAPAAPLRVAPPEALC
jgi:hypothetical protein